RGMFWLLYPYGLILQAIAILHFLRRRPEGFWLWVIIFGGGFGALIYMFAEVVPDVGLLRGTMLVFPRRKRIRELETAILDNPSVGNFEELGDLYLDDRQYEKARECFDRVITPRTDSVDPFYRRALAEIELGDLPAAAADLERVVAADPRYDYHRAAGLLAHTLGQLGRTAEAAACFADVTSVSTLSETQVNYAAFLAGIGRAAEAREWALRVLAKKRTMPAYMRRRERPWFRRAHAVLKRLPATGAAG
ncbi:MAG TPA: hypothetical protein VD833_23190, partial [Vicinamibacterales bacterium]|nr:hypothetical protein [Vicinamibacterales bacterium]